ncbi:hypothetical protein Silverhawkium_gp104 [Shigella phage Silverhawkium]|uniref:Uncharacterized protein n=1 Tax=Shigella phage Silverhawkium TaxID=2530185 RepID=A0A482JMC4_9CAUD|nr:hypothetical protein Silverhawkium_gp104 [Shigella phage Silverhawkium]
MIRTPIKPFGFETLEDFKEYLDKGFYNEQPVTVLKDDLSKLVDIAIAATSKKKTSKKDKEKSEE